jgi:hypothetical protein
VKRFGEQRVIAVFRVRGENYPSLFVPLIDDSFAPANVLIRIIVILQAPADNVHRRPDIDPSVRTVLLRLDQRLKLLGGFFSKIKCLESASGK